MNRGVLLFLPLLLFLLSTETFGQTAVTDEEKIYTMLLDGVLPEEPAIQELLASGADPALSLKGFLKTDYRALITSRHFLLADDPAFVVQALLSEMGTVPSEGALVDALFSAVISNNGFYPVERMAVLRELIAAGCSSPEALRKAASLALRKNQQLAYCFLRDTADPPDPGTQLEERYEIPFSPVSEPALLFDLHSIISYIEKHNKGEQPPMPPRWFTGIGSGFSTAIYLHLASFLNASGAQSVIEDLDERLSLDGLKERNRKIAEAACRVDYGKEIPDVHQFFPFASFLKRRELAAGVSLLLPDIRWERVPPGTTPFPATIAFGRTGLFRGVGYERREVSPDFDIRREQISHVSSVKAKIEDDVNGRARYEPLLPMMPLSIARNVAVGDFFADNIWFQVFVTPPEAADTGVEGRLYLKRGPSLVTVSIFSLVDSDHPAAVTDYLISEIMILLSTLTFSVKNSVETAAPSDSQIEKLTTAIRNGSVSRVNELLREIGKVHTLDAEGEPLWHMVLTSLASGDSKREELFDLFISLGVNPDASGISEKRALDYLLEQYDYHLLEKLLKARAQVDYIDLNGWTPLVKAVMGGDIQASLVLIKAGANVDLPGKYGRTALHWAAQYGYEAMVEELLEARSNPNMIDSFGYTPLAWAVSSGSLECVRLILDQGALTGATEKQPPVLEQALAGESIEIAAFLMEQGEEVHKEQLKGDRLKVVEAIQQGDLDEARRIARRIRKNRSER
jgi:hypothetical protein